PRVVAVGDLDGDGRPDLVTANTGGNNVSVLLGRGDGTFAAQQAAPAPARGLRPFAVAVADVNGDGRRDLITANKGDSTVSVLLGNGDGSFRPQQTFAVGRGVDAVTVADVNGDHKPDIVAANLGDGTVSVLVGNGDGSFGPQQTFATGSQPSSVMVQ